MHRLKMKQIPKINRNKKFLLKLIGFACIISEYFQIFQACHLVCHSHNPTLAVSVCLRVCVCVCASAKGIRYHNRTKKLQYSIYAVNELNIHLNERRRKKSETHFYDRRPNAMARN